MHEPINLVNPVLEFFVVVVGNIIGLSGSSRETIGTVTDAWNVNELEMKR